MGGRVAPLTARTGRPSTGDRRGRRDVDVDGSRRKARPRTVGRDRDGVGARADVGGAGSETAADAGELKQRSAGGALLVQQEANRAAWQEVDAGAARRSRFARGKALVPGGVADGRVRQLTAVAAAVRERPGARPALAGEVLADT